MKREKKLIDDLKNYTKYAIKYIKMQTEEINEFDDGYTEALTDILEIIEKYENETNNDKR